MRSLLPALVVIGRFAGERGADEESRFACELLGQALPPAARCEVPASDWTGLIAAAVAQCAQAGVDDTATVLLLAHDRAAFVPGAVERLMACIGQGASAACARSQYCPPPEVPPDYLTLGGLERFAKQIAHLPAIPCRLDAEQPFAMLARVGALRSGAWASAAVWAPGAYAHDFSGYRSGRREEVLPLVPASAKRVLDVGGGEGGFLAALKAARPFCETHLVEADPQACARAAARVDTVWQGDFLSLPLPKGIFDCISFLDVLEHTEQPAAWLRHARESLAPGGCVVISLPNVGHWSVVVDLLEGRWDYAPAGIHCITHLRFFTRKGLLSLLHDAGFSPLQIETVRIDPPLWFDVSALNRALAIDADSLSTYAFLVTARMAR